MALLEIAIEKDRLEEIYLEFQTVVEELTREKKMWELMTGEQIDKGEQKELIRKVFGEELNIYLQNFLMILLEKNRFSELELIFMAFKEGYLAEKNILEASIFSAVKLTDEQMSKVQEQLEKRTNKRVIAANIVDESILGGLVIYMEGQVIDGSIRSRLNRLKGKLQDIRLEELGVIM